MKIALPVNTNTGLSAPVHGHFGSAPYFALYEPLSGSTEFVVNPYAVHDHGNCRPADALEGFHVKTVICKGMGRGALNSLTSKGIKVLLATTASTLEDAIMAYRAQNLPEMGLADLCTHHDEDDSGFHVH